jgi:predicted MFS family arabinose efflux permease
MVNPPDRQHLRAILLLSTAAFASASTARLGDPMLPAISQAFLTTPSHAAYIVSAFAMAYGVFQVVFGPLGDRIGKYRLIALTTLASVLGNGLAALSGSLDLLIGARLLTGITAAGIIPLSMAWIGDTVPYEFRQATLARFLAGQILGVIGGQFIGGVFTDTVGWRWAFAFLALIYLCVGSAVWLESRRNALTFHRAPDHPAHQRGLLPQVRLVLAARWSHVILSVVFLEGMVVFGGLAFTPLYLHRRFSLGLAAAGALMGLFGVGGLSYTLLVRHFVQRLGERGLALAGTACITAAWSLMGFAPSWIWAMPACYGLGLGYYMLHNTLQTNATQMAPAVRGTAVAMFASAFFLGQSLGVSLVSVVYQSEGPLAVFGGAAALMVPIGLYFARQLRRHHQTVR